MENKNIIGEVRWGWAYQCVRTKGAMAEEHATSVKLGRVVPSIIVAPTFFPPPP